MTKINSHVIKRHGHEGGPQPDGSFILDGDWPPFSEVCTSCKHLDFEREFSCDAFEEIPKDIWFGKNKHTEPYPGDHGIQFEKASKE